MDPKAAAALRVIMAQYDADTSSGKKQVPEEVG